MGFRRWIVSLAVAVPLVVVLPACSAGDEFDRDAAIRRVVDTAGGALTPEQAGCYVDRVRNELGATKLAADAELTPAEVQRRTAIRIDCIGVANLGTTPPVPVTVAPDDTEPGEPVHYGDDPTLDVLYDRCRAGSGPACDELFSAAPLGSEYEQFGVTCGGRTRERRCADRYPDRGAP